MRAAALAAVLSLALAGALAGCGSSSSSTPSQSAAPTVVATATAHNPKLHGAKVLVDSKGFVLYAFSKDPNNTLHSRCLGSCEASWPPLILSGSAPVASGAALGTQLGAIKRPDGKLQVDYAGHPLYAYGPKRGPARRSATASPPSVGAGMRFPRRGGLHGEQSPTSAASQNCSATRVAPR